MNQKLCPWQVGTGQDSTGGCRVILACLWCRLAWEQGSHADSSFTRPPAAQQANRALTLVLLLLLPGAEDTDAAAGVCPADALWLLAAE